jgi:hypothetical protein
MEKDAPAKLSEEFTPPRTILPESQVGLQHYARSMETPWLLRTQFCLVGFYIMPDQWMPVA